TRRLLIGLLWMFAAGVAYPYLPGSQTDAFKGASVFLGLIVTLGWSGLGVGGIAGRVVVDVCGGGRLSLSARQSDGCVQRCQRVPGPDRHARIERPRQPDDERLHDHLLARASSRRLRAHQ